MGLLKGIATAVLEKTKDEVKEYLQKLMEEEKKKKETKETEEKEEVKAEPVDEVEEEPVEEIEETEEEEEDDAEEILPIINEEIERLNYKSKPEKITISYELADLAQQLPIEEFSMFIKMVIFSQDQKKNYGYLGNSLKKKLGLADMDIEEFNAITERLEAYGLMHIETVSDNQQTYILYLPFDENLMKRTNAAAAKKKAQENNQKRSDNRNRKSGNRNNRKSVQQPEKQEKKEEPRKEDELPGRMDLDMKDEDLYKSYRTFVNLEIDKAKMRVGRSNFDKIYMEAVKYIDKKYGFKVLSDSDKFKEYLTNYYISAFDIKTFDQWKKDKA